MKIEQSAAADVDSILELYGHAIRFQQEKGAALWPRFERSFVLGEISEGRQWKIVEEGQPRCVWAITHSDPLIWEARDADAAIYIHRIATHPEYRGRGYVEAIVTWAKDFAKANGRRFIRMDTVGNNAGLIRYYGRCGFAFLGHSKLRETAGLPAHYQDATVCLFEIDLEPGISARAGIDRASR